jgi:hypothetical protein
LDNDQWHARDGETLISAMVMMDAQLVTIWNWEVRQILGQKLGHQ